MSHHRIHPPRSPVLASILILFIAAFPLYGATENPNRRPVDNFDIRESDAKESGEKLARHLERHGAKQKEKKEKISHGMRKGHERLSSRVDGVEVLFSSRTGGPEVVGVARGNRKLTNPSSEHRENVVKQFLSEYSDLYGLSRDEVAQLHKSSEYTNPSGNLSWVRLEKKVKGLSVFRGEVTAAFTPAGELVRTVGELPAGVDENDVATRPSISAAEAVVIAAKQIGVEVSPSDLRVLDAARDGSSVTFEAGPFADVIKAELQYFPLDIGALALSWSLVLWQENDAYYTIVGAEIPDVLFRKNIAEEQTQPATYSVYPSDSPAPLSPSSSRPDAPVQGAFVGRALFSLVSEHPSNNLGWMTDGTSITTGNNVDAGLDVLNPNGIDPAGRATGTAFRIFNYPYDPQVDAPTGANFRMGAVTDLFFWSNRYHDQLYALGFTESARNFQQNNFGRGGLGNDFVRAEAQDNSGTNNANFFTPPDGQLPRMQMYIWPAPNPDRDGDLDHEIVIHELTHGTSNRLHANASGLSSTQSRGMGEGWSDFYALALLSEPGDDPNGVYAMGGYATYLATTGYVSNYYYAIRRFPYAVRSNVGANGKPHNPLTLADIDASKIDLTDGAYPRGPFGLGGTAGAHAVHNIGEVWASALWEVRARIIGRLGHSAGNTRALQIVTDGMKLDPANPSLLDGRNSILAADCAAFAGADELEIWEGFAARGMGVNATINRVDPTPFTVVESFDTPNALLGTVTMSDAGCNNNGAADPAEVVELTIPLRNPFCATTISDVVVTITGGGTASYGAIAPGATVTRTIPFLVPADAECGTKLAVTIAVDGSRGPVTYTHPLLIGRPLGDSQTFDSVIAPAIPSGWTATIVAESPALDLPWRTVTTIPSSPPNAAFSPDPPRVTDNRLVSPVWAITTPSAQLSFRNNYILESNFDGGVLEISIDGGPFVDILAAGGSFVSGGYNGTISNSTTWRSPIRGRRAWTGNSGGYINTVVNLPASAAGHNVQLMWRCGTDSIVSSTGWRVDDITLVNAFACDAIPAPTITGETTDKPALWPPNHQMEDVAVLYDTAGSCGASACTLTVASNEPENGTGDGDTGPDSEVVDDHHVRLRAERSGNGGDRVYTITITCTNVQGASTSKQVTVRVPHDMGH